MCSMPRPFVVFFGSWVLMSLLFPPSQEQFDRAAGEMKIRVRALQESRRVSFAANARVTSSHAIHTCHSQLPFTRALDHSLHLLTSPHSLLASQDELDDRTTEYASQLRTLTDSYKATALLQPAHTSTPSYPATPH